MRDKKLMFKKIESITLNIFKLSVNSKQFNS